MLNCETTLEIWFHQRQLKTLSPVSGFLRLNFVLMSQLKGIKRDWWPEVLISNTDWIIRKLSVRLSSLPQFGWFWKLRSRKIGVFIRLI